MKKFKTFLFIVLFSFSSLLYAAQVNINTADADTLSSELSGIGQSKAEAIGCQGNDAEQSHEFEDRQFR